MSWRAAKIGRKNQRAGGCELAQADARNTGERRLDRILQWVIIGVGNRLHIDMILFIHMEAGKTCFAVTATEKGGKRQRVACRIEPSLRGDGRGRGRSRERRQASNG